MTNKHLALYGLKWNPFAPDVPVEALHVSARTQSFCWRVEQLAGEGGFSLITGAPKLMTGELISALCDHAQGNLRALMNMAGELLSIAAEREARQIDEKLFLETYAQPVPDKVAAGRRR